jgi:hypothetical protein
MPVGIVGRTDAMAEIHIISYFSLETDLAAEMRSWTELRSRSGYSVELASPDGGETVSVLLVEGTPEEGAYVRVLSSAPGALFDRVLGRVTYALAANSDNLMIDRVN